MTLALVWPEILHAWNGPSLLIVNTERASDVFESIFR